MIHTIEIEGETTTVLNIDAVTAPKVSQFNCVDKYKNTSGYMVWINIQNHFSAVPLDGNQNVYTEKGQSARLEVVATATDMTGITYQWYRMFETGIDVYGSEVIEGATDPYYVTDPVFSFQRYRCRCFDRFGNKIDVDFSAGVENHFHAEAKDGINQFTVSNGDRVSLSVIASADDMSGFTYRWGIILIQSGRPVMIEGASSPTFVIDLVEISEEELYCCIVTD